MDLGGIFSLNSGLVFLLDGVDLARQRPRSTGDLLARDLSGHAQVIGLVPLHPGSAQVGERVGDAEDRAPVIEQRLCDQACWPPGGNGEPGGDLGDRPWLPWAGNAAPPRFTPTGICADLLPARRVMQPERRLLLGSVFPSSFIEAAGGARTQVTPGWRSCGSGSLGSWAQRPGVMKSGG